ncbi:ATP-binding cassette transporter ABCA1 [Trypanosoma theileri]|uniref:ATP-binding cassette transporter ABCA1 n=1 Tax=Trypanosoma theileri TaxID=67003 RepID=A0A1X0NUW1_9TRYP|nr:ATP-binding cassette transporter ABCA1 [Trypanosoma theileri]ORC88485.1 ATP-binding cassette transporter ABCA1 [Trypanosoma theileri]
MPRSDFHTYDLQEVTFVDQFLAVFWRLGLQGLRNKFYLLLEIFVPLLFIVITVILWAVWGTEHFDFQNYVDYDNLPMAIDGSVYKNYVCSKDAGGIPGIATCLDLSMYDCEGDESSLPYKGLCVHKVAGGAKGLVGFFLNSLIGRIVPIPTLDGLIMYQWLARKSNNRSVMSSGLIPNTRASAILCSGTLYFVGDAAIVNGIVSHLRSNSLYFHTVEGGVFGTLAEAEALVRGNTLNWGIVHISRFDATHLDARIYLNYSALPKLEEIPADTYPGGFQFDKAELYIASGYLTLQSLISEYHINYFYPTAKVKTTMYVAAQAFVEYRRIPLLIYAHAILPLIIALAFLYSVTYRTKVILLEKEMRVREAMLIMGMRDSVLYASWFVRPIAVDFVVCTLATILLKCTYMTQSDAFVIFMVFIVFTLTTIPFSGLLSTFFSKARLASLLAPMVYFIFTVPNLLVPKSGNAAVIVFALFSPSAFVTLLKHLMLGEVSRGFGANDISSDAYQPTMALMILMLIVDFFLYTLLMLYFDAVFPKDWGTPKHPFFFIIDPIRWLLGRGKEHGEGGPDGCAEDGVFEDSDNEQENAVQLCGLRKVFKRGGKKFVAVDNLYWNIKTSEISVLLGHNGAGKSTTINMMTGMVKADGGDCYVYGLSVRHQLSKVRQQLGFCPQHNILWPELTCREHLEFFGRIKGLKGARLEKAVQRMLSETDLYEKMNCRSSALSGGQKRKLSVGIAFVGESPLVFLDEPTSGMDVGARRHTWELLKRMAASHTILLTTHYMDEADLLGDRIGIMNEGRLQCSGSSMFLKSRLGLGYSMAISVRPDADVEEIDAVVYNCINGAELLGNTGCELTYRLPQQEAPNVPVLLDLIEEKHDLGVLGYSLSATTLEEVFLRVSQPPTEMPLSNNDFSFLWNCGRSSSLFSSQFLVMMMKRVCIALRDRRMQCFQLVCPVVCTLVAMLFGLVKANHVDLLELSFGMYPGETLIDTAQCNQFWGNDPSLPHVIINETHLKNAKYLGDYGADTWFGHGLPRYASISCIDRDLYQKTGTTNPVIMLYNTSVNHQVGISMAAFYQLLFEYIAGRSANVSWYVGTMPSSVEASDALEIILIGAIIMIPFTFLPSNPVAWIVKERECGALHLQKVVGLRFYTYWLTNFLFDVLAYIVSVICIILLFVIFQRKEYIGSDTVGPLLTLFLVYGLTSTVAGYAISFLFSEHSTAQTVVMAVGFVTEFLLVMVVYILSLIERTATTSDNLRWPFRLIPTYCIGEGIINLGTFGNKKASGTVNSAFALTVTGYPILFLGIEFPVFVLLVLLIDHPGRRLWWGRLWYHRHAELDDGDFSQGDSDVEDERDAVYNAAQHSIDDGVVTVLNLQKKYGNSKLVVRGITFSIMPGEVFAFLGTNGAGKTTTISILCQQLLPTGGTASVCGYDVVDAGAKTLECIGYCPQFDGTLDYLTVEEHLRLYCGLRCVMENERSNVIESLLLMCDIARYRRTLAHELSGGNRRKLSVAIALVGGPRVVFLDEPSAGMDPVARRGLWTMIKRIADNCSVVLTTHHLEEVEALGDVVAIMVDGKLRCIGDKTHLKNKYGSGFEVTVRLGRDDEPAVAAVEAFFYESFPGTRLEERRSNRMTFALPRTTKLSLAFELLEKHHLGLGLTDYHVSQTSIEQVFLRISEEAERAREEEDVRLEAERAQRGKRRCSCFC